MYHQTSTPPTAPNTPQLSSTVAWLCAFFAFINIYAMQPVLPMIMRDFGATPVQAGFTVGATILALALLDALGALIVLRGMPASRHFTANRDVGSALRILGRHLRNIPLLTACVVGFCVLFSLIGAFTYVVVLLGFPPFNLSVAALANIFGVYLVGALITPFSGRFIARVGNRAALLMALTVSSGGLCLTLLPSLPAVLVGLTLCSSAIFICQAAAVSAIARYVSEGRSLASGLYYMAYYGGGAAGAWAAGLAFEAYGWGGSVASMIAAQAVAAIAAGFGWRQMGGAAGR